MQDLRETPGRIVIHQNREEGRGPLERLDTAATWTLAILVVVGVGAALVAWRLRRTGRRRATPPADRARRRLHQGLRLSEPVRARLAELASATETPELALLVSPAALRRAMQSPGGVRTGDRAWRRLAQLAEA